MGNSVTTLSGVAIGIIIGALVLSVRHRRIASPRVNQDHFVLRYTDHAKALMIVLAVALPVSALYLFFTHRIELSMELFLLSLVALIVGYGCFEVFKTRIEFDSKHVYAYSPWRKPRIIPWTTIMARTYSPLKRWHVFDTFGYGSLCVSDFMEGKDHFVAKFKKVGQESIDFTQAHSAI